MFKTKTEITWHALRHTHSLVYRCRVMVLVCFSGQRPKTKDIVCWLWGKTLIEKRKICIIRGNENQVQSYNKFVEGEGLTNVLIT